MAAPDVRAVLLEVIAEIAPRSPIDGGVLQSRTVLNHTKSRVAGDRPLTHEMEEAILTAFHDLFRTGYLAWGSNLTNPDPPFFHITMRGRTALERLSRDPGNPEGYLAHLKRVARLNPIAYSYLKEGLACYVEDLPKAAAVMVGGASESVALELRDAVVQRLEALKRPVPRALADWRAKTVFDAMYAFFQDQGAGLPRELREAFQSYWPAFVQQIRVARNEAGHPSSVDPVTAETVHASLLLFPDLARLTYQLREWVCKL